MLFIVKHRSIYRRGDRKHYQDLIVDDSDKKSTHAKCIQLAAYMDDSSVYHSLRDWTIPRMPFSAKVFVEAGVPKGKDMTGAVNLIKQHWKDSDFRADDGELQRYATKLISDGIVKTKSWSRSVMSLEVCTSRHCSLMSLEVCTSGHCSHLQLWFVLYLPLVVFFHPSTNTMPANTSDNFSNFWNMKG